jgi:hypothetical protein
MYTLSLHDALPILKVRTRINPDCGKSKKNRAKYML